MIRTVRADNPGPMTLTGTNSYVIMEPEEVAIVVDPGPDDATHLDRLDAAVAGLMRLVVLTHHHLDHSASAAGLARRWRCPVVALDPGSCIDATAPADGDHFDVGRTRLRVVATPGHTADSLCLLVIGEPSGRLLLTGDTVLGTGSTVIAAPDGNLGDYLRTLDRLSELVAREHVTAMLPGHGPRIDDPADRLVAYRQHRAERLDQVRAALAAGAHTVEEVADQVYPDLDGTLRAAALQSAQAQLTFVTQGPAERSDL